MVLDKEPLETGMMRTAWLFEQKVIAGLQGADLNDVHKVLYFDPILGEYCLQKAFDTGRADAIELCNQTNSRFKQWKVAFVTCAMEQQRKEKKNA